MDHFITKYEVDNPTGNRRAVLEDSIMHRGRPATAGSKILENFISPLDATVVTKLEEAGISILGKTKMDEFGAAGLFPGSSEISASGVVTAVEDGDAEFALCNDYTGAVSNQAVARGLCCIRPTYGTVSRYGLIPAVPSIDQICVVCKTPANGFRILEIISGHDPKDGAMFCDGQRTGVTASGRCGESRTPETGGQIRIGIPENIPAGHGDGSAVREFTKRFETIDTELKHFEIYTQVMQILCCAELSNNITRYDGIKFGYRAEGFKDLQGLYTKTRTEAFGHDAKLASLVGAMVLSQENYTRYYDKAMRIRRLIKKSLEFDKYDIIIMPAGTQGAQDDHNSAPSLSLYALPRLCGLPAVTLPFGGGGITLLAESRREDVLLSVIEAAGV